MCAATGAKSHNQASHTKVPTDTRSIQRGQPLCQQIPGSALDDAIGKLLVDTVTPPTLEVALAVQTELERRCMRPTGCDCTTLSKHDNQRASFPPWEKDRAAPRRSLTLRLVRLDFCNHRQHQFKALQRAGNPALEVRR
jgi:hypothetical protein